MAEDTGIQWCDSTLNLQAGCDGCELWNPAAGIKHCYAGAMTERYAGRKGWPLTFAQPALFPERLEQVKKWKDLTGTQRQPEKRALDGLPRVIFLNDMGDTFTESLPYNWLAPYIPTMAALPCVWLMLTKRPRRMRSFWEYMGEVPSNFVLMTSLTNRASLPRAEELIRCKALPGRPHLALSVEPMIEDFLPPLGQMCSLCNWPVYDNQGAPISKCCGEELMPAVSWVIFGGESNQVSCQGRPMNVGWVERGIRLCQKEDVCAFVKQLGSWPYAGDDHDLPPLPLTQRGKKIAPFLDLKDGHGGDPSEWPESLRVRQIPDFTGVLSHG